MSVTKVLDKTDANMLVQHEDGSVENVSLSPLNRLLFDYGLWGLLREGSEVLHLKGDKSVTVIPGDDAREYTLEVGETEPLHIGEHQKSALIDALKEVYEGPGDRSPVPLIQLYDRLRGNMVRERVMNEIGGKPPFESRVEVREDGWLIKDHLLLTWDNEFIHPETTSRKVFGNGVRAGSSESAYQMTLTSASSKNREMTLAGTTYRLTDSEMEFTARAVWAIKNARNNRNTVA